MNRNFMIFDQLKGLFKLTKYISPNNGVKAYGLKHRENNYIIDDQTSYDLNLNEVYKKYNGCRTTVGEQLFYHKLHTQPIKREAFPINDINPEEFKKLKKGLGRIGKQEKGNIIDDLWDGLRYKPSMFNLIPFWFMLVPLINILTFIYFGPVVVLTLLPSLIINIIIFNVSNNRINHVSSSMGYFIKLLGFCKKNSNLLFKLTGLRVKKSLSRTAFYSFFFKSGFSVDPGDILGMILSYLRIQLLFEIFAYYKVFNIFNSELDNIREVIETVAWVDNLNNSIELLERGFNISKESDDSTISFKSMKHPLIEDCVGQDLHIKKDIIMTGMNMAGKSSFLKSLAINQIMAYSLGIAMADEFISDNFLVITSLKVKDDTLMGKSKYFAEAERILKIRELIKSNKMLCFIDEILTGTNSVERIKASISILNNFNSYNNSLIITATHDNEIPESLGSSFSNYYFDGVIYEKKIDFDYKIKDGIVSKTNGLKLLEFLNLNV